jgi:hypothetical protein
VIKEVLGSLVFENTGRWTKSENLVFLSGIHHDQNLMESEKLIAVMFWFGTRHCPRQETTLIYRQGCEISYSIWKFPR